MIKISVIIPLYDKQNFIVRAVNSVLNQTHNDLELIIVNDGSTDDSLNVVSNIQDHRIKIINKVNGGVSSARNKGIEESNYDWICFLDADDFWLPNHLEEILRLIKKYPEAKIYTTLIQEKSKKGLKVNPNSLSVNFEGYINNYFHYAKTSTIFNSSSVCIHKKALLEIGKFDQNLTHGEDLDVWFRLLIKYKGVVKSVPTVVYDLISENRAMKNFCSYNNHLLSKINSFRNEEICYLNDFIDYFILRNAVPYYFSKNKIEVCSVISTVKNTKNIDGIWKYVYNENFYTLNLILYKLYKSVKSLL